MPLTIRPFEPADRLRWDTLWQGYQKFYAIEIPKDVSDATWARILDPAEPVHGLAAVAADGTIAGFAHYLFHRSTWMTADTCYLQDLYVDPAARRHGAARALIEEVASRATSAGAGHLYWLTHETNAPARALYGTLAENAGFIAYERTIGT